MEILISAFRKTRYWTGICVVVRLEEVIKNGEYQWMQKIRIEEFFVYGFGGIQEVFFVGRYYEQRLTNESSLVLLMHELTGMHTLSFRAITLYLRSDRQLLFGFMSLPLDLVSDERQILGAYELEDSKP